MRLILIAALLALGACGQPAQTPAPEAPAAPQTALEQLQAEAAEQQPVFAWQQLTAYQAAHAEVQPPCTSVRRAEARGVVPANIDPASIYAPYVGATVFVIQCGAQLTTVGDDPRERWLVVFTPGAAEAAIQSCAGAGADQCANRILPTITPQAAP